MNYPINFIVPYSLSEKRVIYIMVDNNNKYVRSFLNKNIREVGKELNTVIHRQSTLLCTPPNFLQDASKWYWIELPYRIVTVKIGTHSSQLYKLFGYDIKPNTRVFGCPNQQKDFWSANYAQLTIDNINEDGIVFCSL